MTPDVAEQSPLPFGPRQLPPAPYKPSPSQSDAEAALVRHAARMAQAPSGLTAIFLHGPGGSGKTRLAEEVKTALPVQSLLVSQTDPLEAFASVNAAAAARSLLLLEARVPLNRLQDIWPEPIPPDVTSRLSSLPQVSLDRPPLESMEGLLVRELKLHGQNLSKADAEWTASALPRDFSAARRFCQALEMSPRQNTRREMLQWAVEKVHVAAS